MVLRYLGLDFFCSSHALQAVISRFAFVSEGYACVIAAVSVQCVTPPNKYSAAEQTALFVRGERKARWLDSSGAEFWSVTLLWRPYSSRK